MNLDMAQFSGINNFYKLEKGSKFLITSQLWKERETNISSFLEYHKRCSQLLWNLFLPLFAFWFMICFSIRKSNAIRIISFVGCSFLLFYFSTNVVASCQSFPSIALFLLYGIPILLCIGFLVRYKKQW